MHNRFLILGAIAGATGVALGAFGAHTLEGLTRDEKLLHAFQTAVYYQLFHALALIGVGILSRMYPSSLLKWSGNSFAIGILLFSGSLYAITLLTVRGSSLTHSIGPITPLGGLCLILGWVLLLSGVVRKGRVKG